MRIRKAEHRLADISKLGETRSCGATVFLRSAPNQRFFTPYHEYLSRVWNGDVGPCRTRIGWQPEKERTRESRTKAEFGFATAKTKERRIDDGRRSNDLRQHGEGRGFPRVESTYRLRSRRSSKFPVINYRVDDRVPPFLLPTSFSLPSRPSSFSLAFLRLPSSFFFPSVA